MEKIDGIYRVDMLGPYGWEHFSTAFIHAGEFRSASAEHFTSGTYAVEDGGFEMKGSLTQHIETRALFGRSDLRDLPIKFNGVIHDDIIDGEARVTDGSRQSHRFRLAKVPALN